MNIIEQIEKFKNKHCEKCKEVCDKGIMIGEKQLYCPAKNIRKSIDKTL